MNELLSLRKCNPQFYNDVMYEWEDELADKGFYLKCRDKYSKYIGILIQKITGSGECIKQITPLDSPVISRNRLTFLMFVSQFKEFYPEYIVPIFVDTRDKSFEVMINAIKNIKLAVITNRSAWQKAKLIYPEKRLYSIPLWCSNKWFLDQPPAKTIDVLQIGRKNSLLHTWMLKYITNNPKVEYVFKDDCSNSYISTLHGNVGLLESRNDFMTKLRQAKICLVSSPLVDSNPEFDFITPRVYEAAMSYCYMIGRFTQNQEFQEIGLNRVVDLAGSYEQFESYLNKYLKADGFIKSTDFKTFISDNSFENRWAQLSEILKT